VSTVQSVYRYPAKLDIQKRGVSNSFRCNKKKIMSHNIKKEKSHEILGHLTVLSEKVKYQIWQVFT
jgi:hypothetical protein